MPRGALIAVMSLVLVGALAMVAQSRENETPSGCLELCAALVKDYPCDELCAEFTGPQKCKEVCEDVGYEPGTKEHGTCQSICVEISQSGQPNTVALCKILKAAGMLEGSSVAHCMEQSSNK